MTVQRNEQPFQYLLPHRRFWEQHPLGGASLLGGSGTVFKTLIGVLILGFIQNGLLLLGLQFYVQFVVTWIIIILAVWLDIAAKRGRLWSPIA